MFKQRCATTTTRSHHNYVLCTSKQGAQHMAIHSWRLEWASSTYTYDIHQDTVYTRGACIIPIITTMVVLEMEQLESYIFRYKLEGSIHSFTCALLTHCAIQRKCVCPASIRHTNTSTHHTLYTRRTVP